MPDPAQKEASPNGKPPVKRDREEILNNPMLLGVVGALVIFLVLCLVLGLLIPGGLSNPFGGKGVNSSSLTLITPGITPSQAPVNTVVPLTTSNPVAPTSPATYASGGNTATAVPTIEPTTMATSSNYVVAADPVSNGDGSIYYPVTVTTTQTIVNIAPVMEHSTVPTIPAEILAGLQSISTPATVPIGQVLITTVPIEAGHTTGPLSWAGSGNYASDLFYLSAGVAKLSVTTDHGGAVVEMKDSTGKFIDYTSAGVGSTSAGAGSNSFTVPASGRYLVDVTSYGTWTVMISMISIKTPPTTRSITTPPTTRSITAPPTTRPITTTPTTGPITTTPTTVPSVPTQPVSTVPQPVIPVTMQSTIPIPLTV